MTHALFRMSAAAAITLLAVGTAVAQSFPTDQELTDLIRSRVEEGRGVGIVLGVLEADGSTRVVSHGDAGANAQPLGERTVFEIGSITKAFTGTLLADMVARGEVSLPDPVSDYLPDGATVPSRGREITSSTSRLTVRDYPGFPGTFLPPTWPTRSPTTPLSRCTPSYRVTSCGATSARNTSTRTSEAGCSATC